MECDPDSARRKIDRHATLFKDTDSVSIRVASAPISWGVMENVELPQGLTPERVLDEIAQSGYAGTELGPYGFLPTEPPRLRAALTKRGLELCSAYVDIHLGDPSVLDRGLATVMTSARLIGEAGARLLILSDAITPERSRSAGRPEAANRLSWSEEEWARATQAIGEIVQGCRSLGLAVAFHHHVGTHVETPEEIDRLLSLVPAADLGLCLDTGHYVYGGGDLLAFLRREVSRIRCVHLKDVHPERLAEARECKLAYHDAVRHGVYAPLSKGSIDFPAALEILRRSGFEGWAVVEADVLPGGVGTESALANAIAARHYLREQGL